MKSYGLSLRRKTFMVQIDPNQLIEKLESFVLHVRDIVMKHVFDAVKIIAMDQTPV